MIGLRGGLRFGRGSWFVAEGWGVGGSHCGGEEEGDFDVAVVVIGERPYAEGLGDIREDSPVRPGTNHLPAGAGALKPYGDTLELAALHPEDLRAIRGLRGRGIPVVAVLVSGRPLVVDEELAASAGFVVAWLPGSEGGGVAEVLFGDFDFVGRLPMGWPGVVGGCCSLLGMGCGWGSCGRRRGVPGQRLCFLLQAPVAAGPWDCLLDAPALTLNVQDNPSDLPPRQGDTESDHLDPRDASRVPVFFGDPTEQVTEANPSIDARHRVRVFVDFWNYTLHMKSVDQPFRTDWSKLGPVLSRAATEVVDRLLQRGAPALGAGRAHARRDLPQRHRGDVNSGSLRGLADALARQRGVGDLPILRAARRRCPSPASRSGSPPGERGSSWHPSFSLPKKTAGCSIPLQTEPSESSRGLSAPLGAHLSFALGLSNEVGPLQLCRHARASHAGPQRSTSAFRRARRAYSNPLTGPSSGRGVDGTKR